MQDINLPFFKRVASNAASVQLIFITNANIDTEGEDWSKVNLPIVFNKSKKTEVIIYV